MRTEQLKNILRSEFVCSKDVVIETRIFIEGKEIGKEACLRFEKGETLTPKKMMDSCADLSALNCRTIATLV